MVDLFVAKLNVVFHEKLFVLIGVSPRIISTPSELTSPPLVIPGYFGGEVTTRPDFLIFKIL